MNLISKRQLRTEKLILENLINRYGGDINLWSAHDNISVALDFYRGVGAKHRKERYMTRGILKDCIE